jgi:ABC-type multidrug transport system ATPase subunit
MGLAPLLVRDILGQIQRLPEEGTTVLVVEQNARAALRIADHGYVLENGRIVLEGKARDLADNDQVKRAYLGGAARRHPAEGAARRPPWPSSEHPAAISSVCKASACGGR